ncbi:MAG: aminotransferase class IV [Acidimicrobiales bacterium]|nr:aminotransferase class IV [Acidimicrobiales bacterium]
MGSVAVPPPSGAHWVDGAIVAAGTAAVSPVDHAIIVGDGVFETLKVVDGVPFALTRHLGRLKRSADGLGLTEPDDVVVRAAVAETLAADPEAGRLRITWSSGPGPLGSDRGDGPGTLLVASSPGTVWPEVVRVHMCEWTRNERGALTGLKTTSYAENVRALEAAHRRGASEALLTNTQGRLCEGTGTNVFLVVDGVLVTPPLSSGCLPGITRELVLELADVVERDVDPREIAEASEAFLTSSTREVGAISAVDDTVLPEAPGLVTAGMAAAFARLVATNPDP